MWCSNVVHALAAAQIKGRPDVTQCRPLGGSYGIARSPATSGTVDTVKPYVKCSVSEKHHYLAQIPSYRRRTHQRIYWLLVPGIRVETPYDAIRPPVMYSINASMCLDPPRVREVLYKHRRETPSDGYSNHDSSRQLCSVTGPAQLTRAQERVAREYIYRSRQQSEYLQPGTEASARTM
ncbi:hypothetical protein OH77DRAFT_501199 [Trametes cingulata]|nr:hypothetical protein OH77DRAFT_501199 [Trametes cingulata]